MKDPQKQTIVLRVPRACELDHTTWLSSNVYRDAVSYAPSMKIAIGGKGGSGKTTVAGTLARVLAERGQQVVALDDDSNPNLAVTLGLPHGQAASLPAIPRDWLEEQPDGEGGTRLELRVPAEDFIERFGQPVGQNLTLLVMGQPDHGGSG